MIMAVLLRTRAAVCLAILSAAVAVLGAADGRGASTQARQFQQKLETIQANAERESVKPLRVTLLETELNAFLLDGGASLPPGVLEPHVSLLGPGQVSGSAIVDLDAVRKQNQPGALSPLAYLSGKLPVSVTGLLKSSNGQAQFELQSAEVNGISVPKILIAELVSYYTRSAALPNTISLDSPFPLPERIKQIDVQRGQVIIIQ
jgi:hypothetical protein